METYAFLANIAQTWGFAAFFIGFALAIFYALMPSNKDKFDKASRMPLEED
ncbi:MAG: cbb3-type cytochrome c oxidase subunit 3 [Salinarimonas sp.]